MSTTVRNIVTEEQKKQYHEEGFMILEGVIPQDHLEMLRNACGFFIDKVDGEMEAEGKTVRGLTHKGRRYFINQRYREYPDMAKFIYSDLMAQVAEAALGPEVFLFNEQWVVKGADKGMKFAWHQDSGYVKHRDNLTKHKPYLTCWCALDDVSEKNGTVYLLPHSRAGTKDQIFDHTREDVTNDLIGYTGDDPGDPVEVPAGSIVAFSSFCFHRSGANTTNEMRRIYLAQYSGEVIRQSSGDLWSQGVPFVRDGQNIYDKASDFADS